MSVEQHAVAQPLVEFVVPGIPIGKGRPRAARTAKGVRMYTPAKTESYEGKVAWIARHAMGPQTPYLGAVSVLLEILLPVPASWSKKKQVAALAGEVLPTSKPDIDNVEKAIFDALNGVCWRDDTQVVDVRKSKRYSQTPCVKVVLAPTSIGDQQP